MTQMQTIPGPARPLLIAMLAIVLIGLPLLLQSAGAAEPAATQSAPSPLSALKNFGNSLGLGNSDEEFLHPDQAFIWSATAIDGNTLRVHWDIAADIYLYRDKFAFELQDASGISLGKALLPPGKTKVDASFGEMVVYYNAVDIDIPLLRTRLEPTEITLVVKYQGCADAGFCYPPITASAPVALPAAAPGGADTTPPTANSDLSEQDRIAATLASGNRLLTLLAFYGFGLLLTFTPCVFPMIPILSSIIVGQGETLSTRRAFTMSAVYVLAMALTYTAAGVFAGMFGENLQAAFQNPWVLGSFSVVFVLLALSMFGFYDLQMPGFLQSRLTDISNKQKGGTLLGVGIMGFLSALIVGPCVAAPLAAALIYIGQTGDSVLGGMALFAMSLGMGTPLLLIGTSAGKILPRAGDWMNTIKAVFGVLLLAVAIWMLERIIPVALSMALWAALAITSGIYMGALEPVGIDASGWRKLWKGIGLILLVYGVLLLVGVAAGGRDSLQPLYGVVGAGSVSYAATNTSGQATAAHGLAFRQVKGAEELEREIAAASAAGKAVMFDLYADWCVACKEMEKYTFSNAGVRAALQDVVLLQADVTNNDAIDKALYKRFGMFGPPTILFFGPDGTERRGYRVIGFMNADKFRDHVSKAIS